MSKKIKLIISYKYKIIKEKQKSIYKNYFQINIYIYNINININIFPIMIYNI